jgi:hypothetical protein
MILNFLLAVLMELYGPHPRLIISKQTTVITEPLRSNGLPDYRSFFRELGHDGVTHENNGAVLFWQAIGPRDMEHEDWLLLCDALDFNEPPDTSQALQDPYDSEMLQSVANWLTDEYSVGLSDDKQALLKSPEVQKTLRDQTATDVIVLAQTRPWMTEQLPPLAEWIERNSEPMKLLAEAVERPKWWSPPPSLLREQDDMLLEMQLSDVENFRTVGRAFCVRAMWHAGEGRTQEAWNDLLICMKFARTVARRPTVINQLVAIGMNTQALEQTVILLHHGDPDSDLAQQILADLVRLSDASSMVWAFDVGERMTLADAAVRISLDADAWLRLTDGERKTVPVWAKFRLDWNQILRDSNRWIDQLIVGCRLSTVGQRLLCMEEIRHDLEQLSIHDLARHELQGVIFNTETRTRLFSIIFLKIMLPGLNTAAIAEGRSIMTIDLTRVAAELAIHHANYDEYPYTLYDLKPVQDLLPFDSYSDEPLRYIRKDDGYLLYSTYVNGKDDGGTNYDGRIVAGEWIKGERKDVDRNESDLVFRVPAPAFAIPNPSEVLAPTGAQQP